MNIIFDGNYLFHKCFSVFSQYYRGQDMSEILQDKEKQQILLRKCVIDMCFTLSKFREAERVVFVIDSSSWRRNLYDDYKYSLTKIKDPFYPHFLTCLDLFEALLRKRGVIVSRVAGAEGDDLMYIWSIYFSEVLDETVVIITGDSDIRQLINSNISLYNNNSKNLKLYCSPDKKVFWSQQLEDTEIVTTDAFEVLLYKVIMGDSSDNIPKLKRGFGDKAFDKFVATVTDRPQDDLDLNSLAKWIALRFSEFTKTETEDIIDKVSFNLKMTWLNISVYNEIESMVRSDNELLDNMLSDVEKQKGQYKYNKKYTLEDFYGSLIK